MRPRGNGKLESDTSMSRISKAVLHAVGAAFLLCAAAGLQAQAPTIPQLAREREAASRNKAITDVEKQQILALYDEALASVQSSLRYKAAVLGQQRKLEAARKELENLKQEVRQPPAQRSAQLAADATSQVIEEALAQASTERDARAKGLASLSQLASDLSRRRDEINVKRADLRRSLESADDELAVVQLTSVSDVWEQAARARLAARKDAVESEIASLGPERDTLGVLLEQVPFQREIGKQKVESAEQDIEMLKERERTARDRDALLELDQIHKLAQDEQQASPALSELAQEVDALADKVYGGTGTLATLQHVGSLNEKTGEHLQVLRQVASAIERRYEASPPFAPSSDWMQTLPPDMPSANEVRVERIRELRRLPEMRREIVSVEDQISHAPALETQVQQLKSAGGNNPQDLETRARALLQLRRRLTGELLAADKQLEARLVQFDEGSRRLLVEILNLEQYVWKRILWARSATIGLLLPISNLTGALAWFVVNPQWRMIVSEAGWLRLFYVLWIPCGLLIIWLLISRRRFLALLSKRAGDSVGRGWEAPALRRSLARAVVSASLVPALLYWLHWLFAVDQMPDLGQAIGAGLVTSAWVLFVVSFLHDIMADGGFADAWLHRSASARGAIRAQTRWLRYALPPLAFVASALLSVGGLLSGDFRMQQYHNSFGRLTFLAFLACILAAVYRLFRALPPAARRGRRRIRLAVLGAIVLLFVLALSGFYVTALFLTVNLLKTLILTSVLAALFVLLMRWRKRVRYAAAGAASGETRGREPAESQVAQLGRFVTTMVWIIGMVFVWSDAFPAISMLRDVELLPRFRIVSQAGIEAPAAAATQKDPGEKVAANEPAKTGSAPSPAPAITPAAAATAAQPKTGAGLRPAKVLTLLDLIDAILAGVFAMFLIRNIPGVLELTALRRFKLDRGAIYAVNTIARYLIVFIAIAVISSLLGIQWTQVQWLAAALTFGIGFGLQDIFANFAAGLILLFDRSLRVGDAVSLGDLSGRVSEIKMRATTVTLWDRSEMVVPNKEFITSKLINWTLSIPETRVDVKVGVAYGSDLSLVKQVLREVGESNPYVLKKPPSEVFLVAFGDSAINFELRVYCLYEAGRLKVLDQLLMAVYQEFGKHGIEIAFPQLDVHIRRPAPSEGTA